MEEGGGEEGRKGKGGQEEKESWKENDDVY